MVRCDCMRRWLMGGGFAFVLVGLGCSSGSSPPASGQGGSGAPGDGGTTWGRQRRGRRSAGWNLPAQSGDGPAGRHQPQRRVSVCRREHRRVRRGHLQYNCPDPLGFAVPPEGGCVHPTSGADTTLRWCCTTALCGHFPSRDARCDCQAANRYDYNCAPGAAATATCAANAGGDFCCSSTEWHRARAPAAWGPARGNAH